MSDSHNVGLLQHLKVLFGSSHEEVDLKHVLARNLRVKLKLIYKVAEKSGMQGK